MSGDRVYFFQEINLNLLFRFKSSLAKAKERAMERRKNIARGFG